MIGVELPYINYHYGRTCLYLSIDLLPNHEFSFAIKSGKYYATFSEVKAYFETAPSYISALFSIADELLQGKITKLLPKYAKAIPYIYPIIQTINIKNLEGMDLMLLPLSYIPGASWFLIYAEFVVPICAQAMTEILYSADYKLKDAIITSYFPDVSPEFLQMIH